MSNPIARAIRTSFPGLSVDDVQLAAAEIATFAGSRRDAIAKALPDLSDVDAEALLFAIEGPATPPAVRRIPSREPRQPAPVRPPPVQGTVATMAEQFPWMDREDAKRLAGRIDALPQAKSKAERQAAVAALLQSWRLPYTVTCVVAIAGGSKTSAGEIVQALLRTAASEAAQEDLVMHWEPSAPRPAPAVVDRRPLTQIPHADLAAPADMTVRLDQALEQILAAIAQVGRDVSGARSDFQWVKTMIDDARQLSRYRATVGPLPEPAAPTLRRQISSFVDDLADVRHTQAGPPVTAPARSAEG